MKERIMRFKLLLFTLFFIQLNAGPIGDLPAERFDYWNEIFFNNDIKWEAVYIEKEGLAPNNNSIDAANIVNNIIFSATKPTVIFFPPGDYYFKGIVHLKSNIAIKGTSPLTTKFYFDTLTDYSNVGYLGAINGKGLITTDSATITSGYTKGSTTLAVENSSLFSIGDIVEISQDNDATKMFTQPGWDVDWAKRSMGQISIITSISGNNIEIDRKLGFTYNPSLNIKMIRYEPLKNIVLDGFRIERLSGADNVNINLNTVYNCYLANIISFNANKGHFWLSNVKKAVVENCSLTVSQDLTDGGHGYGIIAYKKSTDVLITNNIVDSLRHCFMVKEGANRVIMSYNRSSRANEYNGKHDYSLHGHFPYECLMEGNRMNVAGYGDYWGPTGPYNTVFRSFLKGYTSDGVALMDHSDSSNVVSNYFTVYNKLDIDAGVADTYSEGNLAENNQDKVGPQWTTLTASSNIPSSLYLTEKPHFWKDELPWPPFGHEIEHTNLTRQIPADFSYEYKEYLKLDTLNGTSINENKTTNNEFGKLSIFSNKKGCLTITGLSPSIRSVEIFKANGVKVSSNENILSNHLTFNNLTPQLYLVKINEKHSFQTLKKLVK